MELIVTAQAFINQLLLASDGPAKTLDGLICEAVARRALREPSAAISKLLKLRNTHKRLPEVLGIADAEITKPSVRWRIECRLSALVTRRGHLGPLIRLAVLLGELDRAHPGIDLVHKINEILGEAGYGSQLVADQLSKLFRKLEDEDEGTVEAAVADAEVVQVDVLQPVVEEEVVDSPEPLHVRSAIVQALPGNEAAARIDELLGKPLMGRRAGEELLEAYFRERAKAPEQQLAAVLPSTATEIDDLRESVEADGDDEQDEAVAEDRTHAPGAKRIAEPTMVKHALAVLINRLPSRARLPEVTWEQMMSLPLRPAAELASAVESYRLWLETGLCFTDNRGSIAPELGSEMLGVLRDNPSVGEATDAIATAAKQGLGRRLPIIQLNSTNRQSLTRAVVHLVTEEGAAKGGKRQKPKSHPLRPIHLHASKFGDPSFAFTVKGFLKPLALAYGVDLGDLSQPLDDPHYGQLLALLRKGLSLHPVMVVVHGLQVSTGRIAPMLDLVNGASTAIDVIRSLCLGLLTEPLSKQQPPLDRATLWVVCANHEVAELLPFTEKALVLHEDGWAIPKAKWHKVVFGKTKPSGSDEARLPVETGDVPQLPKSVREAWSSRPMEVPPTDHELVLVSTIYRWAEAKKVSIGWRAQAGSALPLIEQLMSGWVQDLVQHDPAGLWTLLAVASTTDGVCLGTLKRLVESNKGLVLTNAAKGAAIQERLPAKKFLMAESVTKDYADCLKLLDSFRADEPGKSTSKTDFSTTAVTRYLPLLCVYREQVSEHLSQRALRWEVGELGSATSAHDEPVDEGAYRGAFRSSIRFCSPALRDAFILAFQRLDEFVPRERLKFTTCVQLCQYSVAVESFAQAGALLARSSMAEIISLQRRRLLIQTLYHLCCVGDLGTQIQLVEDEQRHTKLIAFPRLDWRRRMLSYMVVYQQLIEDRGAWTISRRYGRSELRASLLLALAFWGDAELLTPEYPRGGALTGQFGSRCDPQSRATLLRCLRHAKDESRYLTQLMRNLCHACTDADDLDLARVVLELLEEKAVDKVEDLPMSASQHEDFEVRIQIVDKSPDDHNPKLHFTRLDDEGKRKEAADLCQVQLDELMSGVCARWQLLGQLVVDTLGLGSGKVVPEHTLAAAFKTINKALLDEADAVVKSIGKGVSRLTSIADWAVRWSALQAEEFEDLPPQLEDNKVALKEKRRRAATLVSAWVIFWLSDELRSRIGEQPGVSGERWGRLSSRYFRYGIRLSLRLARILAETGPRSKLLGGSARYLLNYASTRTSILARDYNALFRELFQILLLRASIARTKERLDRILGAPVATAKDALGVKLEPPFLDAFAYMHAAERRWLELGGAGALTRRLVVERINLGQTALWNIFEQAGGQAPCEHPGAWSTAKTVLATLDADLKVLQRFVEHGTGGDSSFWASLHRWHKRRQRELKLKFNLEDEPQGVPT